MSTLYTGPGKIYLNSVGLFAAGQTGAIASTIEQSVEDVSSGFHGRVKSVQAGALAKIAVTPFEDWSLLPTLFPPYLGVTCGATAGALAIGTRPHNPAGAADAAAEIWTPDARSYTFPRAAITKHPDIHLGIKKSLFGPVEITGIGATGKSMGSAGWLFTLAESGAADPGGQLVAANVVRGAWTGIWGTLAGFGAGSGDSPIEAEDEWTISTLARYQPAVVQELVRGYWLESVAFMAKVRPYGPTHTQINAAIGLNSTRSLGGAIAPAAGGNTAPLILSGPSAKTITLNSADVVGAGFDFGGTKVGTGEIGFVCAMTFTAGAPQPLLVFSA